LLWKYKTNGSVNSVSITPDGEYIVAGSGNIYFFVSVQTIEKILDDVKLIISQIKTKYNVKKAEDILHQAEEAFKRGDYSKAGELTLKAKSLALDIDQDGIPNEEDFAPYVNNYYLYTSGAVIFLMSLYFGNKYYKYRKRRKKQLEKEKREIIEELKKLIGEEK